ncbi:response regulator [Pararhizobium arenae]|uniref:response regulator n=1 Tax=Pararhizobium arenae TaxID=1856850 RepID=UPI000AD7986F|nr:response regulator [Pararhizobium arenae]
MPVMENCIFRDDALVRHTLETWARRYSPDHKTRSFLVEQTLRRLGDELASSQNADRMMPLFSVFHRIASKAMTEMLRARRDRPQTRSNVVLPSPCSKVLNGRKILIVEDDYIIASDLHATLSSAGAEVFGPVSHAGRAVEVVSNFSFDAAILDITLADGTVYKAASELKDKRIPFIFLTGYDRSVIPPDFANDPFLSKPCTEGVLIGNFEALLSA